MSECLKCGGRGWLYHAGVDDPGEYDRTPCDMCQPATSASDDEEWAKWWVSIPRPFRTESEKELSLATWQAARARYAAPSSGKWMHDLLQQIGSRLSLAAGDDLTKKILPAIDALYATSIANRVGRMIEGPATGRPFPEMYTLPPIGTDLYAAPVAGTEAVAWQQYDAHKEICADALRYRWLTEDHADPEVRARCRSILDSMGVSSYASTSANVDRALGVIPPTTTTDAEKQS